MVKRRKKNTKKKRNGKGFKENGAKARKINASTVYETCTEQLSPFGGLLPLIKFFDLVGFKEIFDSTYRKPVRDTKLGHHLMAVGILMLLFIGFNRLWHFTYVRLDAMLCGFFQLTKLPVASTFWRYVDSLGINQANSFLKMMRILRERVWQLCGIEYYKIRISIDTTVETLFGNQQGGRKGHNTKNRGKKAFRPILCFIDETREYLLGRLRKGTTVSGKEAAAFILKIKHQLPGCVQLVFKCEPMVNFSAGKALRRASKPALSLLLPTKAAIRPLIPAVGIGPLSTKILNIIAVPISRPVGGGHAALWLCASPKTRRKSPAKRFSVNCLKMIAIFTAYFVPILAACRIKLSPSMTKGPMWKTWWVKPNVKGWMRLPPENLKPIMLFFKL